MRMSILLTGPFLNRTSQVTFHEKQNRPGKRLYTLPATSGKVHFPLIIGPAREGVARDNQQQLSKHAQSENTGFFQELDSWVY